MSENLDYSFLVSRLQALAVELGAAYRRRASLHNGQLEAQTRRADILVALTPADGWPGKNQEQRDAARNASLANNGKLYGIDQELLSLGIRASDNAAIIAALEAERRAIEWALRNRLIEALQGKEALAALAGEAITNG